MGIPHESKLFYCRILITMKKCFNKERYSRKRELIPHIHILLKRPCIFWQFIQISYESNELTDWSSIKEKYYHKNWIFSLRYMIVIIVQRISWEGSTSRWATILLHRSPKFCDASQVCGIPGERNFIHIIVSTLVHVFLMFSSLHTNTISRIKVLSIMKQKKILTKDVC